MFSAVGSKVVNCPFWQSGLELSHGSGAKSVYVVVGVDGGAGGLGVVGFAVQDAAASKALQLV